MVEVFKTNVQTVAEATRLTGMLHHHLPGSIVSFDLQDCDKVLRIEHHAPDVEQVIGLLQGSGYVCSLLE